MHVRAFFVLVAAILAAISVSPAGAETALDRYIAKPDDAYTYQLYHEDTTLAYTSYFLELASQRWRGPAEVDRTLWEHELQITVPAVRHSASPKTAIVIINGGRNDRPFNKETGELLSTLAITTGSVVAMVSQIPNQPLSFPDEVDRPRVEDEILAYSLDKYLDTEDPEWPVHLAMTKAVVRAMDTVQSFLSPRGIEISDFIPIGGSKRGWTAWLTAAVDPRVKAVIPISIDLPNLERQFAHHWEAYGFYSTQIEDYVEFDLPCRVRTKRGHDLLQIIDPYEYRDRYTMPKLVVNSAGDQFFLPDSSKFYFGALPKQKHLRYTFNTDHGQGEDLQALLDVALSTVAWVRDINQGEEPPRFSWSVEADGSIRVLAEDRPNAVNLVQANNPSGRDFRLEEIGPTWTRTALQDEGGGTYTASVPAPPEGWTAFAIELVYGNTVATRQVYSTDVRIVPDVLPYAGEACLASTPGYIDNPQPGGWHGGIAVLSGWVCDADTVDLRFDDRSVVETAYESPRADTTPICGDRDNGFGLLWNLNGLGAGQHVIEALADGRTLGTAQFGVETLGARFMQGLSGSYRLQDFPMPGETATVAWEESLQNFAITGTNRSSSGEPPTADPGFNAYPEAFLENPRHGSTHSGIAVMSGWACDADYLELQFDDRPRTRVPYGTSRADTRLVCGDIDNGFGLLVSLGLLGHGPHTVRIFADGAQEIARASFNVVTFGVPFIRGLHGIYDLQGFPYADAVTTIQWQESLQNFSIREP